VLTGNGAHQSSVRAWVIYHSDGHPNHMDLHTFMTNAEHDEDQKDPTLHSCLFMRFCKGSQLMPLGSSWEIKVHQKMPLLTSISTAWAIAVVCTYMHKQDWCYTKSYPCQVHTESLPADDNRSLVTQFDVWMHSNLMWSYGGEDFTAI